MWLPLLPLKIWAAASQTVAQRKSLSFSRLFFFHSPVKFVGGDCWPRGPTLTGSTSRLPTGCSGEQPMEVSTVEHMDTCGGGGGSTSEASAPLPIRHPSGINAGPYKKQAYPLNSKRPEHLRMNLWRSARIRTIGLFQFFLLLFPFIVFFQRDL